MMIKRLVTVIVFLSAFLLFQVEMIVGKIFLPVFGGSYFVWGACVVFFQAVLLLGYFYVSWSTKRFSLKQCKYWHIILSLIVLFAFPGKDFPSQYNTHPIPMVLDIFIILLLFLGPVFFVLSTMSVFWQVMISRCDFKNQGSPYVLFAASNLGSFLGLLTYPFFFERYFDLSVQQSIWRILYFLLLLLQISATLLIKTSAREEKQSSSGSMGRADIIPWVLYGASPVILFLAVTNILTSEVAPIPLLWILPLSLYLLSFVLNFKKKPFAPEWISRKFYLIASFGAVFYFFSLKALLPVTIEIVFYLLILFAFSMFCQRKLYESKPEAKELLPAYYLYISLGGFIGGVVTSWIAPMIFENFAEYLLGIGLGVVALSLKAKRVSFSFLYVRYLFYFMAIMILWPVLFQSYSIIGVFILFEITHLIFKPLSKNGIAFSLALLLLLLTQNMLESLWSKENFSYRHRNYYGITRIFDEMGVRFLMHGTTIHGGQYIEEKARRIPLTYFSYNSPVGELFLSPEFKFGKTAVVGLGAGTLAVYSKPGRDMDFFELDRDMALVADKYFSFLKSAEGNINIILGDARMALKGKQDGIYDLIIADAFSGDSLPAHLINKEAMSLYRSKIAKNGIILFHVSNRYIDGGYPIIATALSEGANVCLKNGPDISLSIYFSSWIAVTWDRRAYDTLTEKLSWYKVSSNISGRVRPWSDKYSNVVPFIMLKEIYSSLTKFNYFKLL
ncbi:MAG: fused MFS/spermidine synthase [Candidatus Omnitrophica bacterium]|nr:fused MFS/spermidine synthase [Candidatus Omnitrophota bacterium]